MADEIAGGDVRDSEKIADPTCVGSFSDAGNAEENPLDVPLRRISAREAAIRVQSRRGRRERAKRR